MDDMELYNKYYKYDTINTKILKTDKYYNSEE